MDKRSKKDSEDADAIVGKRNRVAKRLWEDEDDPLAAVAKVSGTKVSFCLMY